MFVREQTQYNERVLERLKQTETGAGNNPIQEARHAAGSH